MRIYIFSLILIASCGNEHKPYLEAGKYNVAGEYLSDFGGLTGKTFENTIEVSIEFGESPDADLYTIKVNSRKMIGYVGKDRQIYFLEDSWNDTCGVWSTFSETAISPTGSRDAFKGYYVGIFGLCRYNQNTNECFECNEARTIYTLTGWRTNADRPD